MSKERWAKTMQILITGSAGFIGKNLTERLKAMGFTGIMSYDVGSSEEELASYAARAEFVFHLAGVNRPKEASEFYAGNADLTSRLLGLLAEQANKPPVLITSSAQVGNGTDYGKSKELAEKAVEAYAEKTGARAYIFRLPGVFGKWSRPNYNTVVATFCHNVAHNLPIQVNDEAAELALVYIDDVVDCFLAALRGEAQESPEYPGLCRVQPVYKVRLGQLAEMVRGFRESRESLMVPCVGEDFSRKLYATYLSFLPPDEFSYPLDMHEDERGSFSEFLRTEGSGQVSVNVAKSGVTKGNHWHNTKNEKFLVVSGEAVIRFRKVGEDEVTEYHVSAERLRVVDIPTGYVHSIKNVGKTDLVTVIWASELFSAQSPDTYYELV